MTPIGALARGVLAGGFGTMAMDALWFYRYKRGGGDSSLFDWEFSVGLNDWSQASAPAQLGKRLFEAFFQHELAPQWAPLTNNIMHWWYGLAWASVYGLVAGSSSQPRVRWGFPFGCLVWGLSYVILPLAQVYKPIWQYDLPTLGKDLSAHLVYGVGTAATFRALVGKPK